MVEALTSRQLPEPAGWFAVAASGHLNRHGVLPANVGGRELVVWRSERGQAKVAGAFCPHLGAHLGKVGSTRDGQLRCGFHGFAFDSDGQCVSTGYGGRVPSRACLQMWPAAELDGVVLAWRHPQNDTPGWTIPAAATDGWTRPRWRTSSFAGHPLEITENSVDLGHLRVLHGYEELRETSRASCEGPLLTASYSFERPRRLAWPPAPDLRASIEVSVHGLGFSRVELHVETLGARLRLWVLPTSTGPGRVTLRLGVAANESWAGDAPPALRRIPAALVAPLLREFTLAGLAADVDQDRKVWRSKRHLLRPALAPGDGPVGLYRHWAQQFLPAPTGNQRP